MVMYGLSRNPLFSLKSLKSQNLISSILYRYVLLRFHLSLARFFFHTKFIDLESTIIIYYFGLLYLCTY